MGYYIRFLENKKSIPNWKVQYISTRKKDRKPDSIAKITKTAWDISKMRWSTLGFHSTMNFVEAQVRARQLNSQLSLKKREIGHSKSSLALYQCLAWAPTNRNRSIT